MDAKRIVEIVNSTVHLFSARYRKDAETIANWINEKEGGNVSPAEVKQAIADLAVHPSTGQLMDPTDGKK